MLMSSTNGSHHMTIDETQNIPNASLLQALGTTPTGLDETEAVKRREKNSNKNKPKWKQDIHLLLSQFKSPLIWILISAVILSAFFGDTINSYIILSILTLNGFLGFWQERKASDAIQKLNLLVAVMANVKRKGLTREIKFDEIVPGDIVEHFRS